MQEHHWHTRDCEHHVTEEQAEGLAVWAFWLGFGAGFLGCILLANLLGWYS